MEVIELNEFICSIKTSLILKSSLLSIVKITLLSRDFPLNMTSKLSPEHVFRRPQNIFESISLNGFC